MHHLTLGIQYFYAYENMEVPDELNPLALLSVSVVTLIPSHGPQCEVLMSTEWSQVSWACMGHAIKIMGGCVQVLN